ncbi:hypothetical protein P40081_07255 [Paenibacillus sp. FSL P4-0081]|uniref:hypothetical protein n=1 Tax=Paenibacillus sp. FSL P4-0081 TaxID=1536769 RepID=UPI0004F6A6A6|nr:hypothetical protein [Paenibacillus sp. FSL P4-0081]AIQ27999.1 hypothetical protein P40081_07255 [Paenibacillus sp. FSL P4-0081]
MKKTMLSKTMMGRTAVKVLLATTLLAGVIVGQVGPASATAAKPTAAPIMRDNLSKYGLVKDVELPVTVEAGGLSYTLEKIMIYDIKSETAQSLIKKYEYNNYGKYFVWTKITLENKGEKTIEVSSKDPNPKWMIRVGDGAVLDQDMPGKLVREKNSKEALWTYSLKPGQKLSTYQGLLCYGSKLDHLVISLDVKGKSAIKYIVNRKEG